MKNQAAEPDVAMIINELKSGSYSRANLLQNIFYSCFILFLSRNVFEDSISLVLLFGIVYYFRASLVKRSSYADATAMYFFQISLCFHPLNHYVNLS